MKALNMVLMLSILLYSVAILNAQSKIYSEAPIIFENGIKKSTQVTVHFGQKVFDLPKGTENAFLQDISPQFTNLTSFFNSLKTKYGTINFIKQIPDAVWGDIWRNNLATGRLVKIIDMSQLFTILFNEFVPIDSIINALKNLEEVKYAHQPIQTFQHAVPNDPFYSSQWNLPKINAPDAWDITKGSNGVEIGVIDKDGVQRDHIDLVGKFDPNKGDFGTSGSHGTMVAGIAGAITNNITPIGIASLGWELKLNPYHYFPSPTGQSLAINIMQARNEGCRIINFSFTTGLIYPYQECGRDCMIFEPINYESVSAQIYNTLAEGIICVASVGNGSENTGNCDPGCEVFPYTPWPASYEFEIQGENVGVIGVSATDLNDIFAGGLNWNHGSFVDVSAPGINILTTTLDDQYTSDNGTSYASPHVAALAGLIVSLNNSLTINEVEEIIRTTSVDLGNSGWDEYYGSGRIDAYEALLETITRMANEEKSSDLAATRTNNGRRLVRDQSGNYHFVFTSGNNIFYRKSTDNGSSWSSTVHLSTDGGQNKFPSITTHGNYLFVTYQQYNGIENNQHKYTIKGKWKHLSSPGWATMSFTSPYVYFNNPSDPIPVIVAADNVDNIYNSEENLPEVMIAFKKSDGIYHTNLFYDGPEQEGVDEGYGQEGPIHKIPNTLSGFEKPSIALDSNEKIMLTCNNSAGNMYAYYTTGGSWTAYASNIFNIQDVVSFKNSSITSDQTNKFHISYEGYNHNYNTYSILHKQINSDGYPLTPVSEFANYQYYSLMPSTNGHLDADGGVSIYFSTGITIRRIINDGKKWDTNWHDHVDPLFINANYVNAIDKESPSNLVYAWTSTGEAPYDYNICINCEQPSEGDSFGADSFWTYRRAEFRNSNLDVTLNLQLGDFMLLDANNRGYQLDLDELPANYSFQNFNQAINTLLCDSIPRSNSHRKISFEYNTVLKNIFKIKNENANKINIRFRVKDRATGEILYTSNPYILPEDSTERRLSGRLIIPLNGMNQQRDITLEMRLNGVAPAFLNQSENINLVNTYLSGSRSLGKIKGVNQDLTAPITYELYQNYPNPFNPTTKIKFDLPKSSEVSLKVYDVLGREIKALLNEFKTAGNYEVDFDASNLPSGIYFYTLQTKDFVQSKKMVLLK